MKIESIKLKQRDTNIDYYLADINELGLVHIKDIDNTRVITITLFHLLNELSKPNGAWKLK